MVFFNYATMQMAAKIVYYGPGLCGKTTNLHKIYEKTSPQSRGEMVSLETETDRTLFFDLLPLDVGVIGGFKTRLQLYTIPGQVFYNTTRKLVLKGVDGIVFVADSQSAMLNANIESFRNLRENLTEIGLNLDDLPLVLQLNKRDLPGIVERATLIETLDPTNAYSHVDASAVLGTGVFETLKEISKLTLRTLRKRMMGDETKPSRPAAPAPQAKSRFAVRSAPTEPGETGRVSVPHVVTHHPPAAAAPVARTEADGATASLQTMAAVPSVEEPPTPEPLFEDTALGKVANVGADMIASAPVPHAEPPTPPPPPAAVRSPAPETSSAPPVKHVRVRSSVDVMAELEALRKKATQAPVKVKKEPPAPPPGMREIHKTLLLPAGSDALPQSRKVVVTVTLEDSQGKEVQTVQGSVDLGENKGDVQTVLVTLKIESKQDSN